MPIYEYQCQSCGERTEAIQSYDDPPLAVCPHCGGPLTKLMSAPAFQFKGTGWYVTDYADKGKKSQGESRSRSEESAKGSESGGEKASTSSSDSKSGGGSGSTADS